MKIAKIKPCPFCGSRTGPRVERWTICCYGVICDDCSACGPTDERGEYEGDEERASRDVVRLWNRRRRAGSTLRL